MTTTQFDVSPELKKTGRRFGYAIAVLVNLVMLFVTNNILEWGWLPFLTEDFTLVIPWINFSLVASIIANLIYQFDDDAVVKAGGQLVINSISIFVTYQILRVVPFDFSSYDFNWEIVTRVVLILAMVGAGIGAFAEAVKLLKATRDTERR